MALGLLINKHQLWETMPLAPEGPQPDAQTLLQLFKCTNHFFSFLQLFRFRLKYVAAVKKKQLDYKPEAKEHISWKHQSYRIKIIALSAAKESMVCILDHTALGGDSKDGGTDVQMQSFILENKN